MGKNIAKPRMPKFWTDKSSRRYNLMWWRWFCSLTEQQKLDALKY